MHIRVLIYLLVALLVLGAPLSVASAQTFTPEVFTVDQPVVDGTVRITRLTIDEPGFVVIHADDNGLPGPDIGAVRVEPGIHANVIVPIDEDAATDVLYAMLHTDGGQVGVYEGPDVPDPPVFTDESVEPSLASALNDPTKTVTVAFNVAGFENTIVGTAVGAGNFETLITALTAADLVETLQSEGPFTVFAPTDDAFAALPEGTLNELLADAETLTSILTYHVVAGKLMAADLEDGAELETLQGATLTISLADSAKVNDANIISADNEAYNGVIHVIDAVLLPPVEEEAAPEAAEDVAAESAEAEATPTATEEAAEEGEAEATPAPTEEAAQEGEAEATPAPTEEGAQEGEAVATPAPTEAPAVEASDDADAVDEDIIDIAVAADDFNTLVAALTAADLVDALRGDGPFTVFAPTDDAFAALPEGTLDSLLANTNALTDVLLYHVVPGGVLAADVTDGLEVETLQGSAVRFAVADGSVMINDANIIVTDIIASNGVIHVIDAVILPPADDDMSGEEEGEEMAEPVDLPTTGGNFSGSTSTFAAIGLLLAVLGGVALVQRKRRA